MILTCSLAEGRKAGWENKTVTRVLPRLCPENASASRLKGADGVNTVEGQGGRVVGVRAGQSTHRQEPSKYPDGQGPGAGGPEVAGSYPTFRPHMSDVIEERRGGLWVALGTTAATSSPHGQHVQPGARTRLK